MDEKQRELWRRSTEVFAELLELEPAARAAELAGRELPPAVRSRVEALATADARAAGLLDSGPPLELLAAAAADASPADLAGRRLGAYVLREEIGRGGMAVVYRGERADGTFEQEVAIKVLGTGLLPTAAAQRFRREQELLARLRHRGIAAMLDGGVAEDGTPFLVMERIDGRPIDRYCEERRLDLRDRLRLFAEVCEAVAFAHRNLVVHRDVKPSNVLVSPDGAVKLLDFGIAKLVEADPAEGEATRTYARVLTPGFAAPEQVVGGPITTATDVYGLGRLLERIVGTEARDQDLGNIIGRALRDEPERRYPDARTLGADIESWLAGRPVAATPDSLLYRLGKSIRRHRAGVAAAALVVAVGSAGLAASLVQAARASREARHAAAINAFLTDLFRASDPDSALGSDPPASELFARGAARARAEFRAEPLLLADLLYEIGRIQMERGQYDGAVGSLGEALQLRAERLGEDHPAVARARADLGIVRYHQGHIGDAIALLRRGLDVFERELPANHPDRVRAGLELADMLVVAGEHVEARERSERALARLGEMGAAGEALEGAARRTLGIALHELGELERAASELARAVALERRRAPRGSTDLGAFLSDYGLVLHDLRDLAAAEAAYGESLAVRRRLLGTHHIEVVSALTNLGYVLSDQGRLEASLERHAEALAISRALFPEPHPELAASLSGVAMALRRAGRPVEALPLTEECIRVWRAVAEAARTPSYPNDLSQYGGLLLDLARPRDAEPVLRAAVAEFARLAPSGGVRADVARARLATALARLGRHGEAVTELERALPAIASTPTGWGSRNFAGWKLEHARSLLALGRHAAASVPLSELRARWAAYPQEAWPDGEVELRRLEAEGTTPP